MTTATAHVTPPPTERYTPEDLLAMPDGDAYELVDGELVERNMGWESTWVAGRILHLLWTFCDNHPLGWLVPADASYQCFSDAPGKVRRPDVSFIRFGRLPGASEKH
jgi:Uma2 family endonuclease